jgi:hypothetical protein
LDHLYDGEIPTATELEEHLETYQLEHPDLSLPRTYYADFSVERGSASSASSIQDAAGYLMADISVINEELKNIEDKMGNQFAKYEEFFGKVNSYNDQMLIDAGLDKTLLEDYADYGFGKKLRDCIIEQGYCSFTAEL